MEVKEEKQRMEAERRQNRQGKTTYSNSNPRETAGVPVVTAVLTSEEEDLLLPDLEDLELFTV